MAQKKKKGWFSCLMDYASGSRGGLQFLPACQWSVSWQDFCRISVFTGLLSILFQEQ